MKLGKQFLFLTVIGLLCTSVMVGQEAHQHQSQRDSSEKLGRVSFRVSCSAEAQKQFNRAAALLHSFEYDEAGKAFSQVTVTDPSCAMAYWGIAMTHWHPVWAPPTSADLKLGWAAIEKAASVGAKTEREKDYIAAMKSFYKDADKLDHRTRALAYEKAMEQVYRSYPAGREAAVFYALALNATALPTDKTYANQKKVVGILNKVLPEAPDHPGMAHYIIHNFDYPALAHLALPASRAYAKIAPASAHARHMPSHIFTRLGLWQESINSNLDSTAGARAYAVRNNIEGTWDEELHGMDYLMYAYLQTGQDLKAKGVLEKLKAIHKVLPENFKVAYAFAAMPARCTLERRRWSEDASLEVHPDNFPWDRFRQYGAITIFARLMGAARSGGTAAAGKVIEELTSIKNALVEAKNSYWADQVEIQRRAAAAWLAYGEGKKGEALKLMRSAALLEDSTEKHPVTPGPVIPARELLGDLLIELGQPAQALKEYQTSLQGSSNRFNGLAGAARAAVRAGEREKAEAYYKSLVEWQTRRAKDLLFSKTKHFLKRSNPNRWERGKRSIYEGLCLIPNQPSDRAALGRGFRIGS